MSRKFDDGEKILCFHGPLIYEAKCLKHRFIEQDEYRVHYLNWSKKWDEWVPEIRMLKYTEENLKKQKEVKEQEAQKPKRPSRSSTPGQTRRRSVKVTTPPLPTDPASDEAKSEGPPAKQPKLEVPETVTPPPPQTPPPPLPPTPPPPPPQEKPPEIPVSVPVIKKPKPRLLKMSDFCFREEPPLSNPQHFNVKIPAVLAKHLNEDHLQLHHNNRWVTLPAKPTVSDILAQYEQTLLNSTHSDDAELVRGVVSAWENYFNQTLGKFLLYKWERPQYADILESHGSLPPSKIYGSHHLLRMCEHFQKTIKTLPMATSLPETLTKLLAFLVKNEKKLFNVSNFSTPPPEYHRRAM